MAKVKKAFFCKNCGFEAPKWLGRCPSCGEWNTFAEEIIARESGSVPAVAAGPLPAAKPQRVRDIRESEHVRLDLGNAEVNRVLGGGTVWFPDRSCCWAANRASANRRSACKSHWPTTG